MSMLKSVMVALGLGPDEEYDDRYFFDDDGAEFGAASELEVVDDAAPANDDRFGSRIQSRPASQPTSTGQYGTGTGTVGAVRPIRSAPLDDETQLVTRPLAGGSVGSTSATAASAADGHAEAARPTPIQRTKPRALTPQSFGDAKILADEFKRSVPVIMNLGDADRDLARRLIDFSSGVCYAMSGSMEKLASNVFLLVPRGTEVSAEDRRRIEDRGFDR